MFLKFPPDTSAPTKEDFTYEAGHGPTQGWQRTWDRRPDPKWGRPGPDPVAGAAMGCGEDSLQRQTAGLHLNHLAACGTTQPLGPSVSSSVL